MLQSNEMTNSTQEDFEGPAMPDNLSFLLDKAAPPKSVVDNFTWSDTDKSPNMEILADNATCRLRYDSDDTFDAIRANTGFSSGLHVWEIESKVNRRYDYAMIGVATKNAPLISFCSSAVVGHTKESWGWDLQRGLWKRSLAHNWQFTDYPEGKLRHFKECSDRIKVVLDMNVGTLAFMAGDVYLGVAFTGLPCGLTLYPIMSLLDLNVDVKIRYINSVEPGVQSLKDMCRYTVRKSIIKTESNNMRRGRKRKLGEEAATNNFDDLQIPDTLKRYLMSNVN